MPSLRRALLPLLIVIVSIGIVVSTFQGVIATRLMGAALDRTLSAGGPGATGRLGEGLHVVVCGAGGPLPDPKRSAPCLAVIAGERVYVVDAGAAAATNLAFQQIQPGLVDGVFLTHFHSDHIDGLGQLGVMRWAGGGHHQPLPVFGAEGLTEITSGLNQAYRLDSVYRAAHHGSEVTPPTGAGLGAREFAEPPLGESMVVFEEDGLRVSAFRVDHIPVKPAVGYRFDYKGRSIVVSGDTSKSDNLERFATGVDLLIHEALSRELIDIVGGAAERAGNRSMKRITQDVKTYHASPLEVAQTAQAAGVGHLLYYHVVPATPVPGLLSVFLEGVGTAYDGPVTVAQDGTTISLPPGSDQIRVVSK